jgi:hypothetical protein
MRQDGARHPREQFARGPQVVPKVLRFQMVDLLLTQRLVKDRLGYRFWINNI